MNHWNAAGRHRLNDRYSKVFSTHKVEIDSRPSQSFLIHFFVRINDHATIHWGCRLKSPGIFHKTRILGQKQNEFIIWTSSRNLPEQFEVLFRDSSCSRNHYVVSNKTRPYHVTCGVD